MPFVSISRCSTGCDAFGAPQKTICNPEPDGPSGPGTTKLVQRSGDPPKPVPGSLTPPLDAAVAVVMRLDCLGCGRALPQLKSAGSGLEQPARNASRMRFRYVPDHGSKTPGTTARTGPTVGRMMQLRWRERRIRPLLQ